ncbi:MAG: glycosyltransferase family 4 protein [Desulfobacterales bacterium]
MPGRILHIETGRHLYGGALQVLYLLQGLAQKGYRSSLFCSAGSAIAPAARPFATVHAAVVRGDLDAGVIVRLRRIIAAEKPDLVHVHSRRGADVWGALAARSRRVPALVTRRVDNPEPTLIARVKYGWYARVIAISDGIRRVLAAEGVPAEKIVCVPSGVDHARFGRPCDRPWFRREFGLLPAQRTIAMIAQFIPRKGHRFLIDAARQILARCPAARFLFFGRGPLESDLRRRCAEAGIADRVVFAGFRADLERILPCLDLVVHPAEMEGLGVSLLQAAAAGVPIVAAPAGGIPEIVHDRVNGYLVAASDTGALTDRVTKILADPELAKRLGAAGRKMVCARFSTGAMVAGNIAVYRDVLSNRIDRHRVAAHRRFTAA